MVDQELLDKVRSLAQIDSYHLVSRFVELRQTPGGKGYEGTCPFCGGDNFHLSVRNGLYYCFNCKQGSNPLTMMVIVGKQTLEDVVNELARKYEII